jgi:hypothetical protein
MMSYTQQKLLVTVLAGVAALAAVSASTSVSANASVDPAVTAIDRVVHLQRGGPDVRIPFTSDATGESFLDVTVSAPGVSWAERRNESAVVSAFVDGEYLTDIVITSASETPRQFALGHLEAGRHTLRLHYATHRSRSDEGKARLSHLRFHTVGTDDPEYVADKYAPVVYGRSLAEYGGPFQNAYTDAPLVAWHEVSDANEPGHSVIEYSVVWSNEDGGTSSPGLMALWGRTTDIEWIYRLEVDEFGERVPGSDVYQAPNHQTLPFKGQYVDGHPLLQTCTSNNNMCDVVDDPMRFSLSTVQTRPVDMPREYLMDINPWTYQVMAKEMVREGKIENPSDPATPDVGDQRSYLYVAFDHDTDPPGDQASVGLTAEVKLRGDPTIYRSDHDLSVWSVNRDVPAATTVELPLGTTPADVALLRVLRVPIGNDKGATLNVTDVERAFFLGHNYLPERSFIEWHGSRTLTPDHPSTTLWRH